MQRHTMSFEEANQWLDEVADQLPQSIFEGLNGGIILSPERKQSADGLVTLGTYNHQPQGLGRYIIIYYGSFVQQSHGKSPAQQRQLLREVLHHELTHHVESLAGVGDLVYKDEQFLEKYRKKRKK